MLRKSIFLLISVTGIIGLLFHQELLDYSLSIVELRLSLDQNLDAKTKVLINHLLWTINLLLIFFNFMWFSGKLNYFYPLVYRIINVDSLYQFFFEGIHESARLNKMVFFSTTIVSFSLYVFASLGGYFEQEGSIETLFSLGFLLSAIAFMTSYVLASPLQKSESWFYSFRTSMILFSIIALILLGEELSWGQHLFGWQATGIFKDYNFQSETNLHNFFAPIWHIVVYIFSFVLLFSALTFWGFRVNSNNFFVNLVSPHSSLIVLVFFISLSGISGFIETFENLLALFFLCYGLRMAVLLKDKTP